MNVGIIADTHIPFEKKNYLDFCYETFKKYKCKKIVHIGDLVDNHAISQHEHNPDGFSPFDEHKEALKKLRSWYRVFPEVILLHGNHDERLERAAVKYGLSQSYFKSYEQIWQLPKNWEYCFDHYIFGVRFFHGMGYSGEYAHFRAVKINSCSIVMGHLHSNAGVVWQANESQIKFGLAVGCGIERNTYAFNYGRDFIRKPILGCGLVLDSGKDAMFVPMKIS